jgi:hypothetical protein
MKDIANADPAVLAILGGTACTITLIIVVGWIANGIVQAGDRTGVAACFRALGELVKSFRRRA